MYLCLSFMVHLIQIRLLAKLARIKTRQTKLIAVSLIENFGDIVACEPIARYLRRKHPDAFIVWFVRKPHRELLVFNPDIDRVVNVHCLTEWIWLSRRALFDEIVDLHFQGRVCQVCAVPLNKTNGDGQITQQSYYHFGSLLACCSRSAGLPELSEAPKVYLPDAIRRRINSRALPGKFVVLHCYSAEEVRDWSTPKWKQLAERVVSDSEVSIVEVGKRPALADWNSSAYINLCGKLSLLETAEVIGRSLLFVGIDSGPAHFANALGIFGIVLLGHYHAFERYLPYSGNYSDPNKANLLYADGPVASIEVERVYQAVTKRLRSEVSDRRLDLTFRPVRTEKALSSTARWTT